MTGMGFQRRPHRFGAAIHEIGTGTAMHMNVDESRTDVAALRVDHPCVLRVLHPPAERADPAVLADEAGMLHEPVRQDQGAVFDDKGCGCFHSRVSGLTRVFSGKLTR